MAEGRVSTAAPPLGMGPRLNLSGMMFIQFAIWGSWFVYLNNYLSGLKSADGKSVVVDFLSSEGDIIEHNVFRYFRTPKGLVSFQIARRIYSNKAEQSDIQAFIRGIKTKRNQIVSESMRADLPVSEGAR